MNFVGQYNIYNIYNIYDYFRIVLNNFIQAENAIPILHFVCTLFKTWWLMPFEKMKPLIYHIRHLLANDK